eukprot:15347254-Ditylum_brightwellii.AAC.1
MFPDVYNNITLILPKPIFKDITDAVLEWSKGISNYILPDSQKWVRKDLVKESRFRDKPVDEELKLYAKARQNDRILPPTGSDGNVLSKTVEDNASVLSQSTAEMSRLSEYAERANDLRKEELDRKKNKEENKRLVGRIT